MPDDATPQPPAATPTPNDGGAEAIPERKAPAAPRGPLGVLWHEWVKPLGTVLLVVMAVRSSLFDWNDVPSGSMRPTILEGDRIVVNKLAFGFNTPFNGPKIDVPFTQISFANPLSFLPGFLYASPGRGDTVTFWNPTPPELGPNDGPLGPGVVPEENKSSGIRMVKRIVAVPGDTVEVRDGRLFITRAGETVPVVYAENPHPEIRFEERPNGLPVPVRPFLENLGGVVHAIHFAPGRGHYRDSPPYTLKDPPGRKNDEYYMVGDNRDNSKDSRYYQEVGFPVKGSDITGKALFVAVSFDGSLLRPRWGRFLRGLGGDEAEAGAVPTMEK